jgi:hypothetical protein
MATSANLEMLIGDSDSFTGICKENGVPLPLDGLVPIFTMNTPTRNVQMTLTKLADTGAVQLGPFQHADTFDLVPGNHDYSVVLEDAEGNHVTVLYGKFNLIGHANS